MHFNDFHLGLLVDSRLSTDGNDEITIALLYNIRHLNAWSLSSTKQYARDRSCHRDRP